MENADIIQLSATQLAAKIRSRDLTPTQVVEAHIQRIQTANPRINAVITPMFDSARADAQAKTEQLASSGTDDLPPLFGVPITIKDCWAVTLPTNKFGGFCCTLALTDYVTQHGCVPSGTTNVV